MNKVITINLGGAAYQLEEGGYDQLRNYLETAAARLQQNPDREEILSDIEGAIAEKFRGLLNEHKTVVVTKEVSGILAEMGPVDAEPARDTAGATGAASATGPANDRATPRRLYRIYEGAMISGVCNGVAAYLNIDPTFVRLVFVLSTIIWGFGAIVYLVMAFVVPAACSAEEKAAASGSPSTAREFIHRAKEGYYEAMKNFPDRKARREWQRQFKRRMRAHAADWGYHWPGWAPPTAYGSPRMSLALPFLSLAKGTLAILWVCALVSLLATGALFGMALPASVPVWVAAVVLVFAYGIVAGSVKAARHVCYWRSGAATTLSSGVFLLDAAVWLAVAAVLLGLAAHYFPELREAIQVIPSQLHQAAGDIRDWWKAK